MADYPPRQAPTIRGFVSFLPLQPQHAEHLRVDLGCQPSERLIVPVGRGRFSIVPDREIPMVELSYAVVFVTDMDRSVALYRDVFGLAIRHQSCKWTEFSTPGVTLALHHSDAPPSRSVGVSLAGQCQPGFLVDDIDAFHEQMLAKGVPCLQPPTDEGFGGRLALYADPDGLVLSITARPKKDQGWEGSESDNLKRIAYAVETIARHLDSTQSNQPALTKQPGMGNGQGSRPHRASPYLTSDEAARYLGITMPSLYALVERGHIVPFRGPRRTYRFTVEMLDDYVKRPSAEKRVLQNQDGSRNRKGRR